MSDEVTWKGGRVVEGGGLLNRYTGESLYRGFESLPFRNERSEQGTDESQRPSDGWSHTVGGLRKPEGADVISGGGDRGGVDGRAREREDR